jgi:hypothetical protein
MKVKRLASRPQFSGALDKKSKAIFGKPIDKGVEIDTSCCFK